MEQLGRQARLVEDQVLSLDPCTLCWSFPTCPPPCGPGLFGPRALGLQSLQLLLLFYFSRTASLQFIDQLGPFEEAVRPGISSLFLREAFLRGSDSNRTGAFT